MGHCFAEYLSSLIPSSFFMRVIKDVITLEKGVVGKQACGACGAFSNHGFFTTSCGHGRVQGIVLKEDGRKRMSGGQMEAGDVIELLKLFEQEDSHTRGMGVSRISRFSGAASRPDRELKFFGLSAQTSAKCLAGVLLTQFTT